MWAKRQRITGLITALSLVLAGCAAVPEARPPSARPPTVQSRPMPPAPTQRSNQPAQGFAESIRNQWASFTGRAGITILRDNWAVSQRGDEFMPQQSVSKLWVAIAVMDLVDKKRLSLNDTLNVRRSDLTLFNQPIADMVTADGYETTVSELLELSMTLSDNTANDVLLRRVGGPDAIRAMLAAKGLTGIRFGPGERQLQSQIAGLTWDQSYSRRNAFEQARAKLSLEKRQAAMNAYLANPIDGATPNGIARALLRLKQGGLLSAESTRHILLLMSASGTGKQRLRAGVPQGWGFAHKTGTGQDLFGRTAGYNDVSIMTAPDGTSYAVVVMIAETVRPVPERMQFMQGISATTASFHRKE